MLLFQDLFRLDVRDFGWLSGKLDSHAVFMAPSKPESRSPRIHIRGRDEQTIERIARLVGYNYGKTRKAPGRPEIFQICIRGARAVWLMRQMQPHLMSRQGQRVFSILEGLGISPMPYKS